jgi:competence protein ComEC
MLRIKLIEPVEEKTNSYQIIGRVTHVVAQDSIKPVMGKIILWIEKDSIAPKLMYGDVILTDNFYQQVKEPQNPNTFNYKQFLARQNIFHQSYRRSGEWYHTNINEGNPLISLALKMRNKALTTLENNHVQGKDFAVASALLLGYREFLDEDLQREFAGAGAMHILCVSGLHVGIIFMALSFLFGFLTKLPKGKYLKTTIIISLIWFYAAITGFSPSVLRASAMFSFVAVGQTFTRSTNIYNTLAASALVLIIADPFIISKIGFQLSYIAVISIVSLQPFFQKQLYFKNKLLNGAWAIITVSMAAQIGTGPLSVLYFNQFPNYFLLTNLIVIPLTGLIIQGGIIFFLLAPLEFLSVYAGKLLSYLILILHKSVGIIEGLPGSTAQNLVITFNEQLLIFLFIILISIFLKKKEPKLIIPLLITILFLSASFVKRSLNEQNINRLVVYHVPRSTAIDIFSDGQCLSYSCETIHQNPRLVNFNLRGNRLKTGFINPPVVEKDTMFISDNFLSSNGFISWKNQNIKVIDRETSLNPRSNFPGTINQVIITQNVPFKLQEVHSVFNAEKYIFDSSNSIRKSNQWLKECESLGLDCWSVLIQGAYVWNYQPD